MKSTRLGGKKQLYKSNLIGSFDKLRIFCFILFLNQTKGFEKYSLISCPKHLYLFACALSLIYGGGSRLLPQLLVTTIASPTRAKGTLIAGPALLITYSHQTWPSLSLLLPRDYCIACLDLRQ